MFAEARLLLGALIVCSGLISAQPANVHAAMVLGSHIEAFLSRMDWRCTEGVSSCWTLSAAMAAADDGVGLILGP